MTNFYLFDGLSDSDLVDMLSVLQLKQLEPDEILAEENDPSTAFYLIAKGNFEVIKKDEHNHQYYRIATIAEGNTLGELSLLDRQPRTASIRALEEASVYAIDLNEIERYFDQHPQAHTVVLKNIGKEICKRLRHANEVNVGFQGAILPK